ncbi:MAG: hypothetical protein NT039_01615 [Candidatus Berkelbacteria bacterium]|nr:hypothetical protein [Candidatus Berkelbacteria bacterium]
MKTTKIMLLVFAVLMALTVSAPVLAMDPMTSAVAYGATSPMLQADVKDLTPTGTLKGSASVFEEDGDPMGYQSADYQRMVVYHGLALNCSATVLNLQGEETHRVYFGFPGCIDKKDFEAWSERPDTVRKLKEARKEVVGTWVLAKPAGANKWECWVPSSILPVARVTNVVVRLEGKFNEKKYKVLWVITIKTRNGGRYEEYLQFACKEPPAGLEGMTREMKFAYLMGFDPVWSAPVVSQPPGAMNPGAPTPPPPTKPEDEPVTWGKLEARLSGFGDELIRRVKEVFDSSLAKAQSAPPPSQPEAPDGTSVMPTDTQASNGQLRIRIEPEGGFEVRGNAVVVAKSQTIWAEFDDPIPDGAVVEFCFGYCQGSAFTCTPWGPITVNANHEHPFDLAEAAPGDHILAVRVKLGKQTLGYAQRQLIVTEDN